VGEKCRAHGLTFYYHNHYHEFQLLDGERILDLIVQNTNPDFVSLELDAYWTFRAIEDPAAVIREYGSRIGIIHQKDYPLKQARTLDVWAFIDRGTPVDRAAFESAIDPQQFTELGTGMIKIQDVIDAGNEVGVDYLLVEQDHIAGSDEFESIAADRENLSRMRGLEWR
jgi:sugar phosphate isomerase/epimerase